MHPNYPTASLRNLPYGYPPQDPHEWEELMHRVREWQPAAYLEVGARFGQSLTRIVDAALPAVCEIAVIDLPNEAWGSPGSEHALTEAVDLSRRRGCMTDLYLVDSQSDEAGEVAQNWRRFADLILVDADHTYRGVEADYHRFIECLAPGGHMVFHDIHGSGSSRGRDMGVPQFWENYVPRMKQKGLLVEEIHEGTGYGIGILTAPENL